MPSSNRATRKTSRTSSPLVRNPPETAQNHTQTSLDGWIEPPVAPAAPSFEAHGFERVGVLEGMEPLGRMPSAKVKAKAKADPAPRRSHLWKTVAAEGLEDVTDTAESTPGMETEATEAMLIDEPLPRMSAKLEEEEEEDDDYVPGGAKTAPSRHTKTLSVSSAVTAPPRTVRPPDLRTPDGRQVLSDIVERTKMRHPDMKQSIKVALQLMIQHTRTDEHLGEMFTSILAQRNTTDELNDFFLRLRASEKQCRRELRKNQRSTRGSISRSARRRSSTAAAAHVTELPVRSPTATRTQPPTTPGQSEDMIINGTFDDETLNGFDEDHASLGAPSGGIQLPPSPATEDYPLPTGETTPFTKKGRHIEADGSLRDRRMSVMSIGSNASSELSSIGSVDEPEPPIFNHLQSNGIGSSTKAVGRSKSAPSEKTKGHKGKFANGLKRDSEEAGLDLELEAKRRKYLKTFNDVPVHESSIRPLRERSETVSSDRTESADDAAARPLTERIIPPPTQTLKLRHTAQRPLPKEERPSTSSPVLDTFPPATGPSSRQATPANGRLPKRSKAAARIKMSPVKKKNHVVSAGNPNARSGGGAGGRQSPAVGYDDDNGEQSDNNDYCSACGQSGYLLCCDGCNRAFHFECCDPPLTQDDAALAEPWFCHICQAKQQAARSYDRGLFAPLLSALDKKNPSVFQLPLEIRDFYQDVRTGDDGEYEEVVHPRNTKNRNGYEEEPDYLRFKDKNGQDIFCCHCKKSSLGKRPIIQCDMCQSYWHMDCLDPPMAAPPRRDESARGRQPWVCPLHIDRDLRDFINRATGRKLRIRMPKNPKIVDTNLRRGFRNNGRIEIEPDSEDDQEPFFDEDHGEGIIWRMPAKSIKLDFIDKRNRLIRKERERRVREAELAALARPTKRQRMEFDQRPIEVQQAALSLAQLAQIQEPDLNSSDTEKLIYALIVQAPPEVVALISQTEDIAKKPASAEISKEKQIQTLEALQAALVKKLAELKDTSA